MIVNGNLYEVIQKKYLKHKLYFGHDTAGRMILGPLYNNKLISTQEGRDIIVNNATNRLNTLAFVGISEYLYESMQLFCKTFYLHCDSEEIKALAGNKTHTRDPELTHELEEYIIQRNQIDIILYNTAKQIFKERLKRILE